MTNKDERPLVSAAPEWAQELSKEFCERLDPIFDELWEQARQRSCVAQGHGECTEAEAQNDALSAFSQVVSYPLVLLAEKVAHAKDVPPEVAVSVALTDAKMRVGIAFNAALDEIATGDPFTEATFAAREWLIGQASVPNAAKAAEQEANAISERLNGRANPGDPEGLNMASSLVARALIANGVLHTAADWLAMETGMPPDLARAALDSIVEELPEGLTGETAVKKELVQ